MKDILQQVKKIELKTHKLVDSLITGNYHSVFKGNGIDFSDIREYVEGDELRSIDWKVTARFNRPFVKVFVEERNLRVYFLLDFSASGSFGNNVEKKRRAIEITASLMFSALRNNDSVGMFIATESVERFFKARIGRRHVLSLVREMLSYQPINKKTNLEKSLGFANKVLKKRSVFFIVSDFIDESMIVKPLRVLKRRHDVIAMKITDANEKVIPDVGFIELEDEESGEQILVDTSDPVFRKKYADLVLTHESELSSMCKKYKIDLIEFLTHEGYEAPLKKFFKVRKMRAVR